MDLKTFEQSFKHLLDEDEYIEKFINKFEQGELISAEKFAELKSKEVENNGDLLKQVALMDEVEAEAFGKVEADIKNVAYFNLEETTIAHDTFKLIDYNIISSRKIIPIRISAQDLLIGCVNPTAANQFDGISMSLAFRPAKVLADQFESKLNDLSEDFSKKTRKKGSKKRLGDILVETKKVTEEQLEDALKKSKEQKVRLGLYLVKSGILTNKQLSVALSKQFGIPFVDLDESVADPVLSTLLPKKLCYNHMICPVKAEKSKLTLAMTDPTDIITVDHVEMMTGKRVSPVVSSELSIVSALNKIYGESVDSISCAIDGTDSENSEDDDGLGELSENDAPIIKLVNMILTQAIQLNVSDIHIEVYEHELRIRFRQDGTLKRHMSPAKAAHAGLVSRIKVMANLDIAENRRPQDGRIKLNMQSRKVDLRVSCIPCVWGEKVVMRICDQGNLKVNLSDLGFEPFVLDIFTEGVKSPNGIVLVTGPTGSGKTTTLYSSLFLLNNPSVNIVTAEDPVEYNLMGINQVQCHADIGLDFSAALRSFLRQDPDIIMLGEIRDFETANIAIKAAMTGHLVISTLHTNDAPATVARLLNMGIEPFGLSSSLRIVQAQRLVRKICPTCSEAYKPDKDLLLSLGIDKTLLKKLKIETPPEELIFYKGVGCPDCDSSGIKGRMGIYEVLSVTNDFRALIENQATTEDMRKQALADGMLSLRESALYKLINGITTVQEVFKTTVDVASTEDEADESKPKKIAETEVKTKPENIKESFEVDMAQNSFDGLNTLSKQLEEFNNIFQTLGIQSADHQADSALLKANIINPVQLIIDKIGQTPDSAKILPSIKVQSNKIQYNVSNLAAFIAKPEKKESKCSLNKVIESIAAKYLKMYVTTAKLISGKKEIGKNIKFSTNLSKAVSTVNIDTGCLLQIMSNLLVNSLIALKPEGGEIKILTRCNPKNPELVELVVFDNGVGISKDNLQNIFKPFRPKWKYPTLGLGLAASKKLLNSIGGDLLIKSTPGASTLATVQILISH